MSTSSRPFNGDGRTGQADTDSTPVSTPLKPVNPDLDAGSSVPDEPATYPSAAVQQDLSPVVPDRATIVARQRERFGGIKVGSAFFGWLTATGMAVLLIALLAAAGVAFGVATDTSLDEAAQQSQDNTGAAQTVGLVGAITLLIVLLLAYYCGGYVTGRMARFNGIKQGLACGCGSW